VGTLEVTGLSIDLILPAALWPLGSTQRLTQMNTKSPPGGKGQMTHKNENFTVICELIV
jgi:hypothetical protein